MDDDFTDKILIFTDGACSGNPGIGGMGIVIVYPEGEIEELGCRKENTTNNKMEMGAIAWALQKIRDRSEDVWILTDSTYVIRGITQWIHAWKRRGWKTAEGNEVSNIDLWRNLEKEVNQRLKKSRISWKYVRGHAGVPGNERCDAIAVSFTKKKYIELYHGPLLSYSEAIYDLPENMDLPPMKDGKSAAKKAAYSYLSYVNGELKRHETWSQCEAVVKGRSGAKFKKATSADDERKIVESWGLDPGLLS